MARNDANMIVLSNRYVEEIRALPGSIANPTEAHSHNLLGYFTQMDLILQSNLHFRIIQNKLTPNLGHLASPMREELEFGIANDFPVCKGALQWMEVLIVLCEELTNLSKIVAGWVKIRPYHLILHLVARISARVFVGLPYCRDKDWLEVSTQFTENGKSFTRPNSVSKTASYANCTQKAPAYHSNQSSYPF